MTFSVTMPALGESVTEGTVTRWLKNEGDVVAVDEPLLEVSTDKVDTEIPSPVAGVLQKIVVAVDQTVPVGAELAVIADSGAAPAAPAEAPVVEKVESDIRPAMRPTVREEDPRTRAARRAAGRRARGHGQRQGNETQHRAGRRRGHDRADRRNHMTETRAGFVALIGVPNAGKSTLLNSLVGTKVSIVSRKVQTTRALVRGILIEGSAQVVLVDTPGIFAPKRRLDRAMVHSAWSGAADADAVCLLVDARKGVDAEVEAVLGRLGDVLQLRLAGLRQQRAAHDGPRPRRGAVVAHVRAVLPRRRLHERLHAPLRLGPGAAHRHARPADQPHEGAARRLVPELRGSRTPHPERSQLMPWKERYTISDEKSILDRDIVWPGGKRCCFRIVVDLSPACGPEGIKPEDLATPDAYYGMNGGLDALGVQTLQGQQLGRVAIAQMSGFMRQHADHFRR